jgi:hypothetical protein
MATHICSNINETAPMHIVLVTNKALEGSTVLNPTIYLVEDRRFLSVY